MVDRYTKVVLTIIAGALVALIGQNFVRPAFAQIDACGGDEWHACYIQTSSPLLVQEEH